MANNYIYLKINIIFNFLKLMVKSLPIEVNYSFVNSWVICVYYVQMFYSYTMCSVQANI